jgi:hypothetical protein
MEIREFDKVGTFYGTTLLCWPQTEFTTQASALTVFLLYRNKSLDTDSDRGVRNRFLYTREKTRYRCHALCNVAASPKVGGGKAR